MQSALTPLSNWLVVVPVVLPLLGAAVLLMLGGGGPAGRLFATLIALAVGASEAMLLARILIGGPVSMTMGRWLPPFGISFTADVVGGAFALTAALVTLAVLLYRDKAPLPPEGRLSLPALVLVLLAGADGAFLTGDLFNLYVWFEVMLIASFGLLVLSGTPPALDAAVKYGIVNFIGTSLFLLALGLVYGALGTLNMADIIGAAAKAPPGIIAAIAALLFLAFGIKSAAFPVNTWLPASYHTPPAAISALFGGLLTKVGIYALLRTLVMLLPASRDLLHPAIAVVAGATLVLAPLGALAETNLRRVVGYFLIGGIGAVVVGIALPTPIGIAGSAVYIVNSMLTIAALFLASGLVERVTGEVDIRRMGGLYAAHAPLAMLFLLLVVTVAGLPPSLGFWPKLLLLQAAVERAGLVGGDQAPDAAALPLAIALLLNAFLTLIAGARLWSQIFWRDRPEQTVGPDTSLADARGEKWKAGLAYAATILLAAVVTLAGLWPGPILDFGRSAAAGLLDPTGYIAAVDLRGTP